MGTPGSFARSKPVRMKAKVCLVGEAAVGKTSLIRRFVVNEFDEHYVTTIGTRISRKLVSLRLPRREVDVSLMIWDIMGTKGFRQLLQGAYFTLAHGLLAVADITRGGTLADLQGWIDAASRVTGPIPVIVAGNKQDLTESAEIGPEDVARFAQGSGHDFVMTSAKTGEGVEEAFRRLATRIALRVVGDS